MTTKFKVGDVIEYGKHNKRFVVSHLLIGDYLEATEATKKDKPDQRCYPNKLPIADCRHAQPRKK